MRATKLALFLYVSITITLITHVTGEMSGLRKAMGKAKDGTLRSASLVMHRLFALNGDQISSGKGFRYNIES